MGFCRIVSKFLPGREVVYFKKRRSHFSYNLRWHINVALRQPTLMLFKNSNSHKVLINVSCWLTCSADRIIMLQMHRFLPLPWQLSASQCLNSHVVYDCVYVNNITSGISEALHLVALKVQTNMWDLRYIFLRIRKIKAISSSCFLRCAFCFPMAASCCLLLSPFCHCLDSLRPPQEGKVHIYVKAFRLTVSRSSFCAGSGSLTLIQNITQN